MNITPVIPDGYNGPIKQLTCRICKHLFYLTMADYSRLAGVSYCHECSLILAEELGKAQGMPSRMPPQQAPVPPSYPSAPAFAPAPPQPVPELVSPQPSIRVPQPRTIDRHKMTVEQLLDEAKMLDKTWRYQEALASYEQVLQRDSGCLAALYGKGEMFSHLRQPKEALAVYDELLRIDPGSVNGYVKKGWTLIVLRRYEEALAVFDHALQLEPSADGARRGKRFVFIHLERDQEFEELADPEIERVRWEKVVAQPCHSAEDYYHVGEALIRLDRDEEGFRALERSIELDPLNLNAYEYLSRLYSLRKQYERPLALYDQALRPFPACARLHEERATVLVGLKRYQEALDACNQALLLDNTRISTYVQRGEILHHLGQDEEALQALDQAIQRDPEYQFSYNRKAEVLTSLMKYNDALAAYDRVIETGTLHVILLPLIAPESP